MEITVRQLNIGDAERDRVTATVDISDNDRDRWIRSANIEVSVPKDKIMNVSLYLVEKMMIEEAYAFLAQVLSSRSS